MIESMVDANGSMWAGVEYLVPELILVGAASLLILLDLLCRKKEVVAFAGIAGCLAALVTGFTLLGSAAPAVVLNGMFVFDGYGSFFKLLFYLTCIMTICMSLRYLRVERVGFGEYYALLLLSTAGMMFMASAGDLIVLFLGLELMTLSSYVLIGIRRDSLRSNEAAIKYFLLGGFSTAFLLYGVALIYGRTGTTQINEVASILALEAEPGDLTVLLPVVFLVVGFGYKIAAAPFHMWAPDVYEGAPTPITAFLSVGPKVAAFAAVGRVFTVGFDTVPELWTRLIMVLAVLSISVGSILALAQTNVKRMLAYSSIAHAGFALLGLIAGGPGGLTSMMVYLAIYGLMNLGAFAVVIALRREGVQGETLSDFEGLAKAHPVTSVLMLIFMFSLVGIPPTAGFVGKFAVFAAVIRAGYTPLAVIGVVFSVVSAFFYLRVVILMYMREPESEEPLSTSLPLNLVLAATVAAIIVLGVYPSPLLDFAQSALTGWEQALPQPVGGPLQENYGLFELLFIYSN
jgi:NADH-quinone oxidoreductase subunit N